jgi:hypothetical protein
MTTSLAHGGARLGTLGFHEPKVREMCQDAGFTSVRSAYGFAVSPPRAIRRFSS